MRSQISTGQAVAILIASATALAAALMPLSGGLALLAWPFAVVMILPSILLADRQNETDSAVKRSPPRQAD